MFQHFGLYLEFHQYMLNWPEAAQNDHSCGQRHQRRAVAHRIESFHRRIVHVLGKGRENYISLGSQQFSRAF